MPRTRVRSRILPLPFEGAWAPCRAFSHRTCARGAPRVEFLDAMPARSRERAGGRAHAGPWSVHVVGIYMYPCYTHVCSVAVLGTRRGVDQRRECRARASCRGARAAVYPIWRTTHISITSIRGVGRGAVCTDSAVRTYRTDPQNGRSLKSRTHTFTRGVPLPDTCQDPDRGRRTGRRSGPVEYMYGSK